MGCGSSTRPRHESIAGGGKSGSSLIINALPDENFKKAKVIVMGSLSVGKTSIIRAFVENKSQMGSIQ